MSMQKYQVGIYIVHLLGMLICGMIGVIVISGPNNSSSQPTSKMMFIGAVKSCIGFIIGAIVWTLLCFMIWP